jgi:NADH-quinone oxidoreductase subunit G
LVMMGGGDLHAAYDLLQEGAADTLVILENDLYRRADAEFVDRLLGAAPHVIVLDHLENRTTDRAEIILPAATFAEGDGTFVNNEGRAQRFLQVYVPDGDIQESWRWLRDMNNVTGRHPAINWANLDRVSAALAEGMPVFAAVPQITPPADFRIVGQKVPREPHRYSGRTAILAHINVHEPKPPDDPDVPLAFSMEGYKGIPPASLIPRYWAPGWNSVQALNKFQSEVAGPLLGGDPGIRLVEPAEGGQVSYYDGVPQSFNFGADEWLVLPLFHIFGSDELSVHAPGIAELTPDPYLALNSRDAERLKASQGDMIEIRMGEKVVGFPLKVDDSLPTGLAGLPVGLPGMPVVILPELGKLKPVPGSMLEEST